MLTQTQHKHLTRHNISIQTIPIHNVPGMLLCKTEPLRTLLDRRQQLVPQLLHATIRGQIQLVETRVGRGEVPDVAVGAMNGEALDPTHALQIRKTFHGDLSRGGWIGRKLKVWVKRVG